jgi:hypothetical protein
MTFGHICREHRHEEGTRYCQNIFMTWKLLTIYRKEILALKAKEIINNQFSVLCKQQEFLSLPADKLVEIVSDDDINVTVEETVFEACLEWVITDKVNRQT